MRLVKFAAALMAVFLLSGCGDRPERGKQPDLRPPIARPVNIPAPTVPIPEVPEKLHKLQYGTGFVAPWSGEDQFINRLAYDVYPNDFRYQFILEDEFYNTLEAQERGLVDPITGDLVSIPPRLIELRGPILLPLKSAYPAYYSGDWVLTYDGQADVSFASYQILENEAGRVVFNVARDNNAQERPIFKNVTAPIGNLKLYRLSDEPLVIAGERWNPDFLEYLKNYDIIRTMVSQCINECQIESFDQIAKPTDSAFATSEPGGSVRPANGRYGLPYEFSLDWAIAADAEAWLNVPFQVVDFNDFAKNLTQVIRDSDYPAGKKIYLELGNEIWNYAWPFNLASGRAATLGGGDERVGYGRQLAKLIAAFDKHKGNLNFTYVLASQTANVSTTQRTLDAMAGADLSNVGLALTTYHGGTQPYLDLFPTVEGWEREIKQGGDSLAARVRLAYTRTDIELGLNWVVDNWAKHEGVAARYGVFLIGAYEGGSHDTIIGPLAQSEIFMDWWTNYHWGPHGVAVVREINEAILERWPNAILSDFTGIGQIGDPHSPWFEGPYGEPSLMRDMWREF